MKSQALKNEVWIGLLLAAVVSGAGFAYWFKLSDRSVVPSPAIPNTQVQETKVTAYWIDAQGKKFVAMPMSIKATSQDAIATVLTDIAKDDNAPAQAFSAIPVGTKVLDFSVKDKNIYLNLSKQFTSGGGSAGMKARVTQILYTATSLDPSASLFLSVEGKPLKSLGGEGLEIAQPLQRQDFPLEF